MIRTFSLLVCCCLQAVAGQPPGEIVQVLDVTREQRVELRYMGEVRGLDRTENALIMRVSESGRQALEAAGFRVRTDHRRTASLVHFRTVDRDAWRASGVGGIPGFSCYRTVDETHTDLQRLAKDYPHLAEWKAIGETWQYQNTDQGDRIYALEIGWRDSPHHRAPVLVMAAQHARELTTAEIATRFAEYLVENYETDATARWLLDHRRIHVVAQQNPDGRRQVEQGDAEWRKNQNTTACPQPQPVPWQGTGVDLNRNHAANFGNGVASTDPCQVTYRGPQPGSEPETLAIQTYMDSVFPRQRPSDMTTPAPPEAEGVFLSLHSFSELVLVPWDGLPRGAQNNAPNHDGLMLLGRKLGYYTDYLTGRPDEILYVAGGTTTDYAYKEYGVAAYTLEIGTDFQETCAAFEGDMVQDNLAALIYAAKAAERPYQWPRGPEIINLIAAVQDGAVQIQGMADDTRFYPPLPDQLPAQNPIHDIEHIEASLDVPPHLAETTWKLSLSGSGQVRSFQGEIPLDGPLDQPRLIFVVAVDAEGNRGVPEAVYILPPGIFHDRFAALRGHQGMDVDDEAF